MSNDTKKPKLPGPRVRLTPRKRVGIDTPVAGQKKIVVEERSDQARDLLAIRKGSASFALAEALLQLEDLSEIREHLQDLADKQLFDLWVDSPGQSKLRRIIEDIADAKQGENSYLRQFIDHHIARYGNR